jgi:hypothetical protein
MDKSNLDFYKDGLGCIQKLHTFRSVLSGAIVASALGFYGHPDLNAMAGQIEFDERVHSAPENLFIMPLMSILWFFDISKVAQRSLICAAIMECTSCRECHDIVYRARRPGGIWAVRPVEVLPLPPSTINTEFTQNDRDSDASISREKSNLANYNNRSNRGCSVS